MKAYRQVSQRIEAIENLIGDEVHIVIPNQRQWDDVEPVGEIGDDKIQIGKKSTFEKFAIVNPSFAPHDGKYFLPVET